LADGEAPYADKPAMKVILSIINGAPPQLSKTEKWDQSFRDFVSDCLQKDPSKRPTIEEIFKNHKKFFSKAKNAAFLKENFIMDLPEVHMRRDQTLIL
jgi:serine/threonine protein kinase